MIQRSSKAFVTPGVFKPVTIIAGKPSQLGEKIARKPKPFSLLVMNREHMPLLGPLAKN